MRGGSRIYVSELSLNKSTGQRRDDARGFIGIVAEQLFGDASLEIMPVPVRNHVGDGHLFHCPVVFHECSPIENEKRQSEQKVTVNLAANTLLAEREGVNPPTKINALCWLTF